MSTKGGPVFTFSLSGGLSPSSVTPLSRTIHKIFYQFIIIKLFTSTCHYYVRALLVTITIHCTWNGKTNMQGLTN